MPDEPLATTFYEPAGENRFAPTTRASSPWNEAHQSGIAMCALIAHLIERTPAASPMALARLTVDIVRPTPMAVVEATCSVTRAGAKMQNLEVVIRADGEITARAAALRVRVDHSPRAPETLDYPAPEDTPAVSFVRRDPGRSGVESRLLSGGPAVPGPGSAWVRPAVTVLPGEAASPLVAAAMAADMGSALANEMPQGWSYANVDVAVHFVRPPESEWIFVDARMVAAGDGTGLVNATLADRRGVFARAHQTLFIQRAAA